MGLDDLKEPTGSADEILAASIKLIRMLNDRRIAAELRAEKAEHASRWRPASEIDLDGRLIEIFRANDATSWSHGFGFIYATPREWRAHGAGITHFREPNPPDVARPADQRKSIS
jgi:hypothetical protein